MPDKWFLTLYKNFDQSYIYLTLFLSLTSSASLLTWRKCYWLHSRANSMKKDGVIAEPAGIVLTNVSQKDLYIAHNLISAYNLGRGTQKVDQHVWGLNFSYIII